MPFIFQRLGVLRLLNGTVLPNLFDLRICLGDYLVYRAYAKNIVRYLWVDFQLSQLFVPTILFRLHYRRYRRMFSRIYKVL